MEKKLSLGIIVPTIDNGQLILQELLLKKLNERYNMTIFVLSDKIEKNKNFDKNQLVFLNMEISNSLLKFPMKYYNKINKLKYFKRKHDIDSCISFGKKANILNALSSEDETTILNITEAYDDSFVMDQFVKRMYKKADKIIVNTRKAKIFVQKDYHIDKENVFLIEDILPIDQISEMAAEKVDDKLSKFFEYKVIVNKGDLIAEKGQWHLIKAFFRLKEKMEDLKLLIIGNGPLYDELNELISSMKMEEQIKIIKNIENPYKYLIRSDVFVLSSQKENNTNSLLDAMACARPVISTTCFDDIIRLLSPNNYIKDIDEALSAEYGILVPTATNPFNANSKVLNKKEIVLSDAIFTLLNDYETYDKYMEQSARRAVAFSADNIIKRWSRIIG